MNWIAFAWKNVLRNRRRSLTALVITAIGTAAVLIGGGYALFTYQSLAELTARDSGHLVVGNARQFDNDEDVPLQHGLVGAAAIAGELGGLPGVRAVLPRIPFTGLISNGDKSTVFVGTGMQAEAEMRMRGLQMNLREGQPPAADAAVPQVAIGSELARMMKARVGSSLTLLSTTTAGTLNAVDVSVSAIVSVGVPDIDRRMVLADIGAVQKLLLTDRVGTLSVYLRETAMTPQAAAQARALKPGLTVKTWEDLAPFYKAVRDLYNRIFGILGAIMLVIVLFAMSNTLGMAVVERTREIGTLRAIGTLPQEIVRNFVLEGALIGGAGTALGIVLALATAVFLIFGDVQMPPPPGRSVGYPLLIAVAPGLYAATALAVVALSAAAAWFVSRRAAQKPITEALAHV